MLRDKEWDDRQFNFCNDTMRLQFMYAKYFLSSKNRENKYFISLSFYKAKVGGRVVQVKLCPNIADTQTHEPESRFH